MMPTQNKDKLLESQKAAEHVAEFLAKGGKIQQIPMGVSTISGAATSAFVINRKKEQDEE